jgi:hypothetical protein
MSQAMQTEFGDFVRRFNNLKKIWFSPQMNPQVDPDTGEEIPSAMDRKTLVGIFQNMGLIPPAARKEGPRFMDPSHQAGFDSWKRQWEEEHKVKMFEA